MTLVSLRSLEAVLGERRAITTLVQATYWAGRNPALRIDGSDIIFSGSGETLLANSGSIELEPTDGTFCVRWVITDTTQTFPPIELYTSIPPTGPVEFGDLVQVDRYSFVPSTTVVAAWEAVIAEANVIRQDTIAASGTAQTAATDAETARDEAVAVSADIAALDLVETTSPQVLTPDQPDLARVRDAQYKTAFRVGADGVVDAYDLRSKRRRIGDVQEVEGFGSSRWTVKDVNGKVALQVREDGTTFIADPEFGRPVSPDEGLTATKVILVIVAGQSNGEGRGRPYGPRLDRPHQRLRMWSWPGQRLQQATVPLSSQQQQIGLSLATVVAREFIAATDDTTDVVILNVAAGGSGLISDQSQGNWDPDYAGSNPKLFTIATTAITATLAAIATAYPEATVEPWLYWHQGEADAGATELAYATAHDKVINGLRAHLGDTTVPFISGGIVPENPPGAGVRRALFATQSRQEYAAYADGIPNGGGSQNVGDTVHYHRAGVERLGRNMYWAGLRAATATAASTPHKPLDVSATFIAGTLTARWSEPISRYTDFVVEYSIDGGAWTAATRTIPTETSEVVTGLTGTVVRVRISSKNGSLVTIPTIPITATGV